MSNLTSPLVEPPAQQTAHVPAERDSLAKTALGVLQDLASLRVTVVLLALSIFLVFSGTLVQVDKGIWSVVSGHFRCWLTWIELKIFFPRAWGVPGSFPFPGGWAIGSCLLANILAAHTIKFKVRDRGLRLAAGLVVLALGMALTGLVISGYFSTDIALTKDDSFWRVLFRMGHGTLAALGLLAGCVLLFRRRAGIVLLHGGIILMLVGELVTAQFAKEGTMRLEEGQSSNYIVTQHRVELAIAETSHPESEEVTVVPGELLERRRRIDLPELPFDLEIKQFMPNSDVRNGSPKGNPATQGEGLQLRVAELDPVSGTDRDQKVDIPSAYVDLLERATGKSLGTWLFSLYLGESQRVEVQGRSYAIGLRFQRTYKPYRIELLDFRHDKYIGTDTPMNFSSDIRLVDPSRGVDRQVKIWMNNPLRYAGETFYQASFDQQNDKVTVLQVVENVGWMIPYVSCMIVSLGLLAHFCQNLFDFLRKRAAA